MWVGDFATTNRRHIEIFDFFTTIRPPPSIFEFSLPVQNVLHNSLIYQLMFYVNIQSSIPECMPHLYVSTHSSSFFDT